MDILLIVNTNYKISIISLEMMKTQLLLNVFSKCFEYDNFSLYKKRLGNMKYPSRIYVCFFEKPIKYVIRMQRTIWMKLHFINFCIILTYKSCSNQRMMKFIQLLQQLKDYLNVWVNKLKEKDFMKNSNEKESQIKRNSILCYNYCKWVLQEKRKNVQLQWRKQKVCVKL